MTANHFYLYIIDYYNQPIYGNVNSTVLGKKCRLHACLRVNLIAPVNMVVGNHKKKITKFINYVRRVMRNNRAR